MTLEVVDDVGDARWLLPDADHAAAETALWFGPAGFEACARVLQLPDPAFDRQAEAELADEVLDEAPGDVELVTGVVDALGSSSDDLCFALWDGYPYRPPLAAKSRFDLAGLRQYALAAGTVDDWARWVDDAPEPHGRAFPPAFVWPADRSWCLAFDVDAHFAGVGGSAAAVARLLDAEGLRTVPATYGSRPPLYG